MQPSEESCLQAVVFTLSHALYQAGAELTADSAAANASHLYLIVVRSSPPICISASLDCRSSTSERLASSSGTQRHGNRCEQRSPARNDAVQSVVFTGAELAPLRRAALARAHTEAPLREPLWPSA